MTPRSGSTYIQDGRITRSAPTYRYRVYWFRLLLVIALLATLVVTNPANDLGHWIPDHYTSEEQKGSFLFSILRPQDTNFGLFALSRSMDGVSVSALQNTFPLCEFDSPVEDELVNLLCGWIDDTFCHGKPLLDWNDLPFTVNRLLCWLLMAIMISPFFMERSSAPQNRKMAPISVLYVPTIWDVIRTNLVVYPALVSMDRLIRSYLVIDGYMWQFLLAFFILIFVIGGICNQIGSAFQREPINGMGAAFAACLGYHRALGMASTSLFQFVDYPFSASTLFWLEASMLFLQGRPGHFVAWMTGAMAGHTFAQLHQQWLAEALRSNVKSALQRGVKQVLNFF